ncbi:glycosyltransferase [Mycobacterium sp. pV006]|uniref:glycosyltransferase n=1 Tax=Mycobacterium sp. pV006 TaxID=3238983 RepID=UPI00351B8124
MTTLPSVCALIVTYGNRAHFCRQVAQRLAQIGVGRIIIVDNASDQPSRDALEELRCLLPQVVLIRNEENLGSSGGYRRAFETALTSDDEYLFLLDDDNLPQTDCLTHLLSAYHLLEADHPDGLLLYANRGSTRPTDRLAFQTGFIKAYPPNSFVTFVLWRRGLARLSRAEYVTGRYLVNFPVVRVHFGPYGGMFGRRKTFESAGSPRSDFYLYLDDHEYATRMDQKGIAQFLVEAARIDDLEVSQTGTSLLSRDLSPMRLYYQIRNGSYLSQTFIRSRRAYAFNKYSFFVWEIAKAWRAWITAPNVTLRRWRILLKAVHDGEAGNLGRKYPE